MYKLALIGFGVVGQGFAELLRDKEGALREAYGLEFKVVAVCDAQRGSVLNRQGLDLRELLTWAGEGKNLDQFPGEKHGLSALETIEAAGAEILFEATWTDIKTGEPGTSHIRKALSQGMHVVTTNKGPMALFAKELLQDAESRGLLLRFEGTVMSGTPVLNLLRYSLAGCRIEEVQGILNGTTNYILTQMAEGDSYEDALKAAQQLGYAEAVPDADVLGWDALAKVCILANTVFGAAIRPDPNVLPCVGITGISVEDVAHAKKAGKVYKLIGRVWREGNEVRVSVGPRELDQEDPLAGVNGAQNALKITTDVLGEVTIRGFGAGKIPTGYSMLVDFLDIHHIAAGGSTSTRR